MSNDQNENPDPALTDSETGEPSSPSVADGVGQPPDDSTDQEQPPSHQLRLVVDDDGRGKPSSFCLNIFVGEELIGLIQTGADKAKLAARAFKYAGVPVKLSWTHR